MSTAAKKKAVVILGPPWPRSGTARVIQSQIDFYRQRGFITIFVVVPYCWDFRESSLIWNELRDGIFEMGADHIFIATLPEIKFRVAKYTVPLLHPFKRTMMDLWFAAGAAAETSNEFNALLETLSVEVLQVNHIYTLGFAASLQKRLSSAGAKPPMILETHDVQAQLLHSKKEPNPWGGRPYTLEELVEAETELLKHADVLVHLSVEDMNFFRERLPDVPHLLALPTIDESFVSLVKATEAPAETIDLLFVGQSHFANLDAMKWFFEEVWPLIADHRYNVRIVGPIRMMVRNFLPEIYDAFRPRFVGEVSALAPYYRAARCVIAPMVSGTGTSIKTIEALALGKPFVGTSKAFRGMPMEKLIAAGIQAFDTPREFADAIVRTLSSELESQVSSRAAYDRVFSPIVSFAAREEALRVATELHRPQLATH